LFETETIKKYLKKREAKYMKYSKGEIVKFKLESGEVQKGDIRYIEKTPRGEILYINSFNRWAYKIPEKRVISRIRLKK
jgi:hypothetical protein